MEKDLISIITPMYNASKYVAQTLESVLKQTYQNWEMIIVNDGSKDNSADIVSKYTEKDSRIHLINQLNGGSAAARNNALRHARGRYISFLDSDDLWESDFLEKQIRFIKEKNATIVFASYKRIDENNNEFLRPFIVPDKVNYKSLLKTCSISCLTAMYDKEKTGEVFFNEALRSLRDDLAFWLSILKRIDYAYGNKDVLASYRVFITSTSGNKKKIIKPQFNIYRNIEKLNFVTSVYYLVCWAINGIKKYR